MNRSIYVDHRMEKQVTKFTQCHLSIVFAYNLRQIMKFCITMKYCHALKTVLKWNFRFFFVVANDVIISRMFEQMMRMNIKIQPVET